MNEQDLLTHRANSTKTRIETLFPVHLHWLLDLTERIPLKQGLKRIYSYRFNIRFIAHRANSTKTRIETTPHPRRGGPGLHLTERIPLKQGLKQRGETTVEPLSGSLTERIPLKQGLKLSVNGYDKKSVGLTERIPLKQGLKRNKEGWYSYITGSHRANSTKTRIETFLNVTLIYIPVISQSEFH